MNYNTQQVYWGVLSSNHADQHFPYVDLCEKLLPMAEAFARDTFGLPGAFFPHSAYPVPSMAVPYPALPWGYEVCETPWTVQSLWWHYKYTLDKGFLKRAYPLIRPATRFLAAYLKPGPDGKYHVAPTVSPETWGCTVDYRLNRDCIMDLALVRFILGEKRITIYPFGRWFPVSRVVHQPRGRRHCPSSRDEVDPLLRQLDEPLSM